MPREQVHFKLLFDINTVSLTIPRSHGNGYVNKQWGGLCLVKKNITNPIDPNRACPQAKESATSQ